MRIGTLAAATVLLAVSALPLAGAAEAQDLDCRDFRTQQEAQAEFDRVAGDPNRLDADKDMKACEALSNGGVAPAVPGGTPPPVASPSASPSTPVTPPVPHGGVRAGHGPVDGGGDTGLAAGLGAASALAAGGAYALRRRQARQRG
ncbi:excalibur calcium-binding protein [Kitasatospora sp. NPDC004289]